MFLGLTAPTIPHMVADLEQLGVARS